MPDNPRIAPPWQPRFTIAGIMLATLVVCVAMAGVSYLVRFRNTPRFGTLVFLLITLAGPLVLLVAVSVVRALSDILSRPKRK